MAIEHITRDGLEYFAKEMHKEMLSHTMCHEATSYYEKLYHNMFKTEYKTQVGTATLSADIFTPVINYTSNLYINLLKEYTHPDDETGEKKTDLTFLRMTGVTGFPDDFVVAKQGNTQYTAYKTFKLTKENGDFKKDYTYTYSVTATGVDGEEDVTGEPWNATIKISFVRPNFWFNSLDELTAETFDEIISTSTKQFKTGKNQDFQTVEGKPLIFCSTNPNLNFEQFGATIIHEKKSIETYAGTYYCYITGNGAGNIWNSVTIS